MNASLQLGAIARVGCVALVACMCVGGTKPASAEVRRVLVSVDELEVPSGKSVRGFRIETWGVEFLAVCKFPRSWELKSEKFQDSEGYLEGRADVHGEPLDRLTEMYLVDVYDYQALPRGDPKGDYHPASFGGWVEVGPLFGEGDSRRHKLTAANFHLKDAQSCPASPPAKP